ncbi:hypothetical protein LZ30DRAFT_166016 [Colletotrichum cereale]|nr:hypothetical protein LZ30DRAFT_166016 [Colletotrichum cereale]
MEPGLPTTMCLAVYGSVSFCLGTYTQHPCMSGVTHAAIVGMPTTSSPSSRQFPPVPAHSRAIRVQPARRGWHCWTGQGRVLAFAKDSVLQSVRVYPHGNLHRDAHPAHTRLGLARSGFFATKCVLASQASFSCLVPSIRPRANPCRLRTTPFVFVGPSIRRPTMTQVYSLKGLFPSSSVVRSIATPGLTRQFVLRRLGSGGI